MGKAKRAHLARSWVMGTLRFAHPTRGRFIFAFSKVAEVIDGGTATRRDRTQFIKRMVEFAQTTRLKIHLVYYPPYHSKYNPVERCWAALENYWNGTVLDSIETALQWAAHMSWKGIAPVVHLLDSLYHKGIKVPLPELEQLYLPFWQRSETLPKWDITVYPI